MPADIDRFARFVVVAGLFAVLLAVGLAVHRDYGVKVGGVSILSVVKMPRSRDNQDAG